MPPYQLDTPGSSSDVLCEILSLVPPVANWRGRAPKMILYEYMDPSIKYDYPLLEIFRLIKRAVLHLLPLPTSQTRMLYRRNDYRKRVLNLIDQTENLWNSITRLQRAIIDLEYWTIVTRLFQKYPHHDGRTNLRFYVALVLYYYRPMPAPAPILATILSNEPERRPIRIVRSAEPASPVEPAEPTEAQPIEEVMIKVDPIDLDM